VLTALALRPAATRHPTHRRARQCDVITAIDLAARTEMVIAQSRVEDTPETRQRLRPQVLRALIDDRLRQQAADKDGVSVPQDRIDERMSQLAQNNNMGLDQFREVLRQNNLDPNWLEDQIRTEIAWGMLVNRKFRAPSLSPTPISTPPSAPARTPARPSTASRIFLSVDDPNDTEAVRRSADRLISAQEGRRFRRDRAPVLAGVNRQQWRSPRLGRAGRPGAGDRDGGRKPAARHHRRSDPQRGRLPHPEAARPAPAGGERPDARRHLQPDHARPARQHGARLPARAAPLGLRGHPTVTQKRGQSPFSRDVKMGTGPFFAPAPDLPPLRDVIARHGLAARRALGSISCSISASPPHRARRRSLRGTVIESARVRAASRALEWTPGR
jgi:hypothetical protein